MRASDRVWPIALTLGAVFIWAHDRAWLSSPDDALPLLAALPLLVWLSAPLRFESKSMAPDPRFLALAGVASVAGIVAGFNLLLAIGWTAALWAWLGIRLESDSRDRLQRLLPLALLAFPWLTLDFPSLAWWFRISAAWSAEVFYQALGLEVQRVGCGLTVAHLPFDVAPACSGIKALQSILVGGTAFCFLQTRHRGLYWIGVLCLPLVAWLANTARVITIVATALSINPDFAEGWFHDVGGWAVVLGVFGLMWLAMRQISRKMEIKPAL